MLCFFLDRMDQSHNVCLQLVVNFDDRTNIRRPRAGNTTACDFMLFMPLINIVLGTTESGIDMNQFAKSEARKQNPNYIDSSSVEIESDTMSTTSPDILSDEGTEDEGIESGSIRNYQGAFIETFK